MEYMVVINGRVRVRVKPGTHGAKNFGGEWYLLEREYFRRKQRGEAISA